MKTYKFAKMSDRVVVTSTKRDENEISHDDSRVVPTHSEHAAEDSAT